MQWLSNFNQSLYYTRLAYPQNFIVFGSQKLKIWFKQVCMHSKTLFKFLFNSSKFSTISVHVIFFLNTRPPYESNKIVSTPFGSTNLELRNLQNSTKTRIFELSFWTHSHWRVGPGCQPTPPVSETKTGEAHATARRWWNSPTVTPPATPRAPTWSTWCGESIGASGKT